jgi:hypothetical protein
LADHRLYDFRARMYQPELGRFLQPDPKQFEAGDYNIYRYCHNDPVNRTDPFGLGPPISVQPDTNEAAIERSIITLNMQLADPSNNERASIVERNNQTNLLAPMRISIGGPLADPGHQRTETQPTPGHTTEAIAHGHNPPAPFSSMDKRTANDARGNRPMSERGAKPVAVYRAQKEGDSTVVYRYLPSSDQNERRHLQGGTLQEVKRIQPY